jgi:glycosyltransferase involved in cell wall biosynthesis
MIYVCVAARNNAATVGLVLWKVRQVFEEFSREYGLLVADDASTDGTADTLEPYTQALPMTLISSEEPRGYAASMDILVRKALELTDRPKRDCLVTLPADFSVSPTVIPDLVKRTESGADVVVGETTQSALPAIHRFVRRSAPWLLKPGIRLTDLRDVLSGVYAFRLVTLKACIRANDEPLLDTSGGCANAELLARAAAWARQIAVVPLPAGATPQGPSRQAEGPLALALSLFRAGRKLEIPAPQAPVHRASS